MFNLIKKVVQNRTFIRGAILLATSVGFLLVSDAAMAAGLSTSVTLKTIGTNIDSSVSSLASILSDISLIAGIGFIMASFFKFHQHKQNPTQVPLSQGVALLLIGAGLALFPSLLPTASKAVIGSQAGFNQVGGKQISKLIGNNGS